MPPEPATTSSETAAFHASGPVKHDLPSHVNHQTNNYEEDDSSSDHDSEEDGERFSLCDYDLDVVDEALMNPDSNEYRDHFGFRIQVKTDDEDESSDSEMSSDDDEKEEEETKKSNGSDTDHSVDTALTTPITAKHPPTPLPPLEIEPHASAPTVAPTARRARGRAATISKPNTFTPIQQDSPVQLSSSGSEGIGTTMTATTGRRRRATTVSRPQPPPIPSIPLSFSTSTTKTTKTFETVGEEGEEELQSKQSITEQPFVPVNLDDKQDAYQPQQTVSEEKTTDPVPEMAAQLPITEKKEPVIDQLPMTKEKQEDDHTVSLEDNVSTFEQEQTNLLNQVIDTSIGDTMVPKEKEEAPLSERQFNEAEQKPSLELHKELPPLPQSTPMGISKSTASDHESIRSSSSDSNNRSRSDSVGAKSYTSSSFHPFRRAGSPTSIRTGTRAVERPSTAYRERQSRRMSEFYRFQSQPSSPSTPFQVNHRLSYASASSYYDMLMSKFGRHSEDAPPLPRTSSSLMRDSPKQTALKEEAKQYLEDLKMTDLEGHYDYQFWEMFVHDTDDMIRSQQDSVKHHMIAGMPPSLRGYVWQIMSKSRNNGELESEYRELLKRISPHEKSIQRDLARTFPTHEFFKDQDGQGQASLFNVTKAYSLFDQQVGYCQGLPFIVGCLLLHMPDDMAFCVLIKLMSQYGLRGQFMPQMELLHERLYQFDHILQQKLPQIHKHLEAQGVQPSMYCSQWFLTLFASKCPLGLVYRVFDMVLLEGAHVVLRFALALMFRNQHTLLNLEFEALVDFLNNSVFDTYKDDENGFVHDAYSMDIPTRLLTRLAKQHATEAAREAKTQSQEEHLRRINTELSSHVRRLEKSYRNLEHEHQEVTQQVIDAKMNVARMEDENQQLRWQLGQVRTELEQLKTSMPIMEDIQRQNKQLSQKNGELGGQLEDVEAILISLKMKYVESETAYEEMKQKLHKAGITP